MDAANADAVIPEGDGATVTDRAADVGAGDGEPLRDADGESDAETGAHTTPTAKTTGGSTTPTAPMRALHSTAPLALHTSAIVVFVTRLGQQPRGRTDTEPTTAPRATDTFTAAHGFRSLGPDTKSVTKLPSVAKLHTSSVPHDELDTHGCAVARFAPEPSLDANAPTSDTSTPTAAV